MIKPVTTVISHTKIYTLNLRCSPSEIESDYDNFQCWLSPNEVDLAVQKPIVWIPVAKDRDWLFKLFCYHLNQNDSATIYSFENSLKGLFGCLRSRPFLAGTDPTLFKLLKETQVGIVYNINRTRPQKDNGLQNGALDWLISTVISL